MVAESKEGVSWAVETSTEVVWETKQSLSLLEKETWVNFFKKAWDRIKGLFKRKWNDEETSSTTTSTVETRESSQSWWDKISNWMFQELLKMEGSQDFVAHAAPQFWEKFVTWPYGMVYKHIDTNGNLLNKPVPFTNGERVSKSWAENNARAHYDKCAKWWKKSLDEKWLKYNQNELDSLVSASWGTVASKKRLESYVLSHWSDKNAIFNYMSTFATTAAWNWKKMPGLVRRRKFEANWFKWNTQPFSSYRA